MVMSMYDTNNAGLSMGGDNNGKWTITEDDGNGATTDHPSTLATTTGWHCLEIVIDAAGMVSGYVDGTRVIGPFARNITTSYSGFPFGLARTVVSDSDVFVDDVAIGRSRLYCPP